MSGVTGTVLSGRSKIWTLWVLKPQKPSGKGHVGNPPRHPRKPPRGAEALAPQTRFWQPGPSPHLRQGTPQRLPLSPPLPGGPCRDRPSPHLCWGTLQRSPLSPPSGMQGNLATEEKAGLGVLFVAFSNSTCVQLSEQFSELIVTSLSGVGTCTRFNGLSVRWWKRHQCRARPDLSGLADLLHPERWKRLETEGARFPSGPFSSGGSAGRRREVVFASETRTHHGYQGCPGA